MGNNNSKTELTNESESMVKGLNAYNGCRTINITHNLNIDYELLERMKVGEKRVYSSGIAIKTGHTVWLEGHCNEAYISYRSKTGIPNGGFGIKPIVKDEIICIEIERKYSEKLGRKPFDVIIIVTIE
jgi:hypothetical protein